MSISFLPEEIRMLVDKDMGSVLCRRFEYYTTFSRVDGVDKMKSEIIEVGFEE